MTAFPQVPPLVRCPVCADEYYWPTDPTISLYNETENSYEFVDVSSLHPAKQADLARRGYRQCPNPSSDTTPHYLPATYATYREPLVIGLVGAPRSGKTHLLTAMIRQAYRGGLGAHRVTTAALDFRRHALFQSRYIEPFEKGGELSGTDAGIVEAADILLLRGPGGEHPVTFFDIAGEDFESTEARNRATRFLIGANAVIFVYASEDPLETGRPATASENRSFDLAVERLRSLPGGAERLPVAIAVTKSDRLRYVPPADRWLRQPDNQMLDAARIRAESRDVYAYLHYVGAGASLRPFDGFPRCTLHFVSASGGDAVRVEPDNEKSLECYFPRGIRPTRVLEPLVAILAMTGMITGPEAQKVGMP
jgi:GTPase SAR1 family protein